MGAFLYRRRRAAIPKGYGRGCGMSTGDAKIAADVVTDAKRLLDAERAEQEQLELLAPVSAEEMVEARQELGAGAGRMAVLRHAREKRGRGRPPGSRNKRTDDFARYLLGFGQHPAITMMQIQSTQPEMLIEASKQEKVHSFNKHGEANVVVERMTYAEAQSLRIRCAENLLPYLESKKPVAVDMSFAGVGHLMIEGVTHGRDALDGMIEGGFVPSGEELPPLDDAEWSEDEGEA